MSTTQGAGHVAVPQANGRSTDGPGDAGLVYSSMRNANDEIARLQAAMEDLDHEFRVARDAGRRNYIELQRTQVFGELTSWLTTQNVCAKAARSFFP